MTTADSRDASHHGIHANGTESAICRASGRTEQRIASGDMPAANRRYLMLRRSHNGRQRRRKLPLGRSTAHGAVTGLASGRNRPLQRRLASANAEATHHPIARPAAAAPRSTVRFRNALPAPPRKASAL